jgi:hypothetical protein
VTQAAVPPPPEPHQGVNLPITEKKPTKTKNPTTLHSPQGLGGLKPPPKQVQGDLKTPQP